MSSNNDQIISELAAKTIKGDVPSFRALMRILNEIDHPVLDGIDLRVKGLGALDAILAPISTLVLTNPKPRVSLQSIIWSTGEGRPHRTDGPAELWFSDLYLAYSINGARHREDGPAVVDVSNESIFYYTKGNPRTHEKGPFKVERHEGHIMLTYVMGERVVKKAQHDDLLGSYEEENYASEQPGDHVIVTRDFVDIEGIGQSEPTDADMRNLAIWSKNYEQSIREGRRYLEDFLKKFE